VKAEQESRAIAGRTARCHCKFRHLSNFTTALDVRFPRHSTAFLLFFTDFSESSVKKWYVRERTSQIAYLFIHRHYVGGE